MAHGQKPAHRSGEQEFKKYMERFPPSLRTAYQRIHDAIKAEGKRSIEWYHLGYGETRYRGKDAPGQRGKIFAWLRIYDGWLVVAIPEHDPDFAKVNSVLLKTVESDYRDSFWYGKGQFTIPLDVGSADFESKLASTLEILRHAMASAV